jgi:hypothetical protein
MMGSCLLRTRDRFSRGAILFLAGDGIELVADARNRQMATQIRAGGAISASFTAHFRIWALACGVKLAVGAGIAARE